MTHRGSTVKDLVVLVADENMRFTMSSTDAAFAKLRAVLHGWFG